MNLHSFFASLPPEWGELLQKSNREGLLHAETTLVVLDDDPTGTQTVHDVPVLTKWDASLLKDVLLEKHPLIFLLTNSRALTEQQTIALHKSIANDLSQASQQSQRSVEIISRSDSTLRGHFPLETDVVERHWHEEIDLTLVIPFFKEGGRLTKDSQHYVAEGEKLIEAHETPFAKDAVFAFEKSYLPDWVEEKSNGRIKASEVVKVSLQMIREGGPAVVAEHLLEAPKGAYCVIDGVDDRDMEVVASALLEVRKAGRTILARTAASYVRAVAGLAKRDLLTSGELREVGRGGLIVVGSHVPKTTSQFDFLINEHPDLMKIELQVEHVLEDFAKAVNNASELINIAMQQDKDVVFYTSRSLVAAASNEENLRISSRVSEALVASISSIAEKPRFILAKGGITSSDVATKALAVQRAEVVGSILPGIPVWCLGEETRFPKMHYIIFPGNVGGHDALAAAYKKLKQS